jgi:hypothetical protein
VPLLQKVVFGAHQRTAVAVFRIFITGDQIQITFRSRIKVVFVVAIAALRGLMKMERTAATGALKMHTNSLG